MKRLLFALLLIAVSVSFPAACMDNVTEFMSHDTGISIGLVMFFTILVITIAFVFSRITNNAALTIFYKDEFFHLVMSAIFLVSIGGIMFTSCTLTTGFLDFGLTQAGATKCYNGTQSAQQVAYCAISSVESRANTMLREAIKASIAAEMDSTLSLTLYNPLTGGITMPIGAYRRTEGVQLDMVAMTYVMPAVISLGVQKLLVGFSIDLIKYILPIAFIFRILPVTRKIGNLFIAIAIVLYTVVPVMYAMNASMDELIVSTGCSGNTVSFESSDPANPPISLDMGDEVMGGCNSTYNFWSVAALLPHAFFFPNLTLAIAITCLSGIDRALNVIG